MSSKVRTSPVELALALLITVGSVAVLGSINWCFLTCQLSRKYVFIHHNWTSPVEVHRVCTISLAL